MVSYRSVPLYHMGRYRYQVLFRQTFRYLPHHIIPSRPSHHSWRTELRRIQHTIHLQLSSTRLTDGIVCNLGANIINYPVDYKLLNDESNAIFHFDVAMLKPTPVCFVFGSVRCTSPTKVFSDLGKRFQLA